MGQADGNPLTAYLLAAHGEPVEPLIPSFDKLRMSGERDIPNICWYPLTVPAPA